MRYIQVACALINIDVHRLRTEQRNSFSRRNIGETGRDNFVTRPDTKCHLNNLQGISAIGTGDAVSRPDISRQSVLQLGYFRTQDVLTMTQYALNTGIDRRLYACLLLFQVDELNHDQTSSFSRELPRTTYVAPVCEQMAWPSTPTSSCSPNSLIQPICLAGTPTISA
ncbi:hypothetical protein D3C76_1049260 [compost metagenome]